MGGRKAQPSTDSSAKLSPTECPNCGGTLEFEGDLPEGLCVTCGIYVELLKAVEPPAAKTEPGLDREGIEVSAKKDLEGISRAHGLKTSGKKGDLAARLQRYLDIRDAAVSDAPDSESERAIARRGLVLFLLSLRISRKAAEAMASLFGSLRAFQRAAEDDIELLAGLSSSEVARIRDAIAHGETVPPPEEVSPTTEPEPVQEPEPPELLPSPVLEADSQLVLEPPPELEPEGIPETEEEPALVPPDLEPEPEPVSEEAILETEPLPDEPALAVVTTGERETTSFDAEAAPATRSHLRRDRWMLYAGTFLQAIGGFGLVLGSLLHDVFRIPWMGQNYAAFGSVNATFAVVGVILLMAGLAAIGFSLRGGVVRPPSATEV